VCGEGITTEFKFIENRAWPRQLKNQRALALHGHPRIVGIFPTVDDFVLFIPDTRRHSAVCVVQVDLVCFTLSGNDLENYHEDVKTAGATC
jgi:hypothetical protein